MSFFLSYEYNREFENKKGLKIKIVIKTYKMKKRISFREFKM